MSLDRRRLRNALYRSILPGLVTLVACFFNELTGPKRKSVDFRIIPDADTLMVLGGHLSLRDTVAGADSGPSRVRWSSSNPSVATVDSLTGAIHGTGIGTIEIRAHLMSPERAFVDSQTVRVHYNAIKLDPLDTLHWRGQEKQFRAWGLDSAGTERDTITGAVYSVTDTVVIKVSASGLVTARHNGSRLVTVVFDRLALTDTQTVRVNQKPKDLRRFAGDTQGSVGQPLATPPAVEVRDSLGSGVPQDTVDFLVKNSNGVITGTPSITDDSGVARASWTLGTKTVVDTLTAISRSLPTDSIRFTARALPGPASVDSSKLTVTPSSVVRSGDTIALHLQEIDRYGNVIARGGDTVVFSCSGGTSSCAIGSTTDHGDGTYSALLVGIKAGTATTAHVKINKQDLKPPLPAITVLHGNPARVVALAGDGQSATVGTKVKTPPVVQVLDLNDNPVPGAAVTFAVTSGGIGAVSPDTPIVADTNGRAAAASWLLDTIPNKTNLLTAAATPGAISLSKPFSAVGTIPRIVGSIRLGTLQLVDSARQVVIDSRRGRIYVGGSGGISLIDARADTAVMLVPTRAVPLAVDSVSGHLYAAKGDTVIVLDGSSLAIVTQRVVNGMRGLADLSNRNELWIVVAPDTVSIFDATTLQILKSIFVPGATSVGLNSTTDRGYVVSRAGLAVLDAAGDTLITSSPSPHPLTGQIGVNRVADWIFVSSDSGLEVFDGAGTWLRTVPLLSDPLLGATVFSIAVDETTNRIYATVFRELQPDSHTRIRDDLVAVVDSVYNVTRVATGEESNGVAANPTTRRVYVAGSGPVAAIRILDEATNQFAENIVRAGPPVGVTVDTVSSRVYVVDSVTDNLFVIDAALNLVIGLPIHYPAPSLNAAGVAVDMGGKRLYITHSEVAGYVDVLDGQSYQYLNTIFVSSFPHAIAVNQVTHEVYVANDGDGTVSVMGSGGQVTSIAASFPSSTSIQGLAIDESRNLVASVDGFTVIDGSAKMVIGSVQCGCGGGVALNPSSKRAYAGLNLDDNDQRVAVLDYTVGRQDTAVAINGTPEGVSMNVVTNVVFVPTAAGIAVISGELPILAYTIPRGTSTRSTGVAMNQVTGLLYIADAASNSIIIVQN